jgi:hypothetical protein
MPVVSRLDSRLGCTFVVWYGEVTPDEWHAHFEELLASDDFPPGSRWLTDLRYAHADLFDNDELAAMGDRVNDAADIFSEIRMAVIPNGAWYKARKLLEHEVKVRRFRALQFTGFDTACVWLSLPITEATMVVEDLLARAQRRVSDESLGEP